MAEIPVSWQDRTRRTIAEWEALLQIKILYWLYFGSRSSGITHQCSSIGVDFVYLDPLRRPILAQSYEFVDRYRGFQDYDFNGVNQDRYYSYQDFRGRSLLHLLDCMRQYSEWFYQTPEDERHALAEAHEQVLFKAMIFYVHSNSELLDDHACFLKEASPRFNAIFDPAIACHFYRYLARKNQQRILDEAHPKLHSYLYTIRAILGGVWVLEKGAPPPASLKTLLEKRAPDMVTLRVQEYLALFASQRDKNYRMLRDAELDRFIEENSERLAATSIPGRGPLSQASVQSLLQWLENRV